MRRHAPFDVQPVAVVDVAFGREEVDEGGTRGTSKCNRKEVMQRFACMTLLHTCFTIMCHLHHIFYIQILFNRGQLPIP